MDRLLDARGYACPLPVIRTRAALACLAADDGLVVLATDPEAPVDIGALAADAGRSFSAHREDDGGWRLCILPSTRR